MKSLRKQEQLYKDQLLEKPAVSTYRYKSYRNCLQHIIRKNRQQYLHDKCTEFKQNGRKLWQLINKIIGKTNNKLSTTESLRVDNLVKYDSNSITEMFNEFFSTIGELLAQKQMSEPEVIKLYMQTMTRHDLSIFLAPTSSDEIHKLIENLPNKTSSGYDKISSILLKSLSKAISTPLEIIFNRSLEEGVFPDKMKLADVVPPYKNKDNQECTNYRPISLLISLSKLLEKIMYKRVYQFLEDKKQIFPSQYGFRSAHSCENAISELLSNIRNVDAMPSCVGASVGWPLFHNCQQNKVNFSFNHFFFYLKFHYRCVSFERGLYPEKSPSGIHWSSVVIQLAVNWTWCSLRSLEFKRQWPWQYGLHFGLAPSVWFDLQQREASGVSCILIRRGINVTTDNTDHHTYDRRFYLISFYLIIVHWQNDMSTWTKHKLN